ncbi:MAG: hypothetical protein NVSMB14_01000 [Isosphaeraceae bacterium]
MSRVTTRSERDAGGKTWPAWAKGIASAVLLFHITAIFVTEAGEMPSSEAEQELALRFAPYVNFINQHNTHRYYSPQPGPTPTLLFRIHYKDEKRTDETIRIPDPSVRPRIRFQKQLAIAENVSFEYGIVKDSLLGAKSPTEMLYPAYFARRLCKTHPGAASVEVILRIHNFPPPQVAYKAAAESGTLDLDQDEFYAPAVTLGVYPCDEP